MERHDENRRYKTPRSSPEMYFRNLSHKIIGRLCPSLRGREKERETGIFIGMHKYRCTFIRI